jgi:hypothetical protein
MYIGLLNYADEYKFNYFDYADEYKFNFFGCVYLVCYLGIVFLSFLIKIKIWLWRKIILLSGYLHMIVRCAEIVIICE